MPEHERFYLLDLAAFFSILRIAVSTPAFLLIFMDMAGLALFLLLRSFAILLISPSRGKMQT